MADLDGAARQVALGEARAFRVIVEATADRLYRVALRMTGSEDDARDVVQEAFVRAHRALADGKWKGESKVETWLYRIVLNTAMNHRRSRNRRTRLRGPDAEPVRSPEWGADVLRLMSAVLALPPEQRAALVLKELEGHTSAEVGELLGCSEGAVEQRLLRARATLKKRFADE